MEKSCKRCYWYDDYREECLEDGCVSYLKFTPKCCDCDYQIARYEIEGGLYCEDCILDVLGIEVGVKHVTEYFICDDYIGNDEDEIFDIVKSVNKSVKVI